MAWVKKGKK